MSGKKQSHQLLWPHVLNELNANYADWRLEAVSNTTQATASSA